MEVVTYNKSSNVYARKHFNDPKEGFNEARTLFTMRHEHIVEFKGIGPNIEGRDFKYMVMEAADNLSLRQCKCIID